MTPLACSLAGQEHRVRVLPGSRAAALYGADSVVEDFFCNYGLNNKYRSRLEKSGVRVAGVDDDDEVRIVELDAHPFFVATLYCFQTRSTAGSEHPLVAGFVAAARAAATRAARTD